MAKANRQSKKVVAGISPEEFDMAMSAYALADAEACKVTAKMDKEMTAIREKYQDQLKGLEHVRGVNFEIMESYCKENKDVLFSERRSMGTIHGIVGFRLGTPKLKTLPKWTWEKVLDKVRSILPEYVRKHEEVDKESLILDRKDEKVAPHLNEIGVYVTQDEAFYVELKKEEPVAA